MNKITDIFNFLSIIISQPSISNIPLTVNSFLSENVKLEDELRDLNTELFKLKIKADDLNKKYEKYKYQIEEFEKKIKESKNILSDLDIKLNEVTNELEDFKLQVKNIVSKISAKKSEKEVLEQKKEINENKKNQHFSDLSIKKEKLKEEYRRKSESFESESSDKIKNLKSNWSKKLNDLNQQIEQFKTNNFFLLFLSENSEEKIPEMDIIINLLKKEQWNLDDLKNEIDLPPILAIRTIKQMAVKKIVNFDEENGVVSISKNVFNS